MIQDILGGPGLFEGEAAERMGRVGSLFDPQADHAPARPRAVGTKAR